MKATVSTGKGLNFRSVEANIPNIRRMTPKNAISFRNLAFGVGASATVCGGGKTYRVTGIGNEASARKQ